MIPHKRHESLRFFLGDIVFFYISLWVALTLRHFSPLVQDDIVLHFAPFSILIAVWTLSFFIAGLYNKQTLLFKRKLPFVLLHTQIINSVIGVFFFYFIPYFAITPKTTLFIYLFVSFIFVLAWRLFGGLYAGARKREEAVLIGTGKELEMLRREVNNNPRYTFRFVSSIDLDSIRKNIDVPREIAKKVSRQNASVVVVDFHDEDLNDALPTLYELLLQRINVMDFHKVYEQVFDRIPISLIGHDWILDNISITTRFAYDVAKRLMDIAIAAVLGIFSLAIYPFVIFAIMLDDRGSIFIYQERVGQHNSRIKVLKFRTMRASDRGKWVKENDPRITRVGGVLRVLRIDELPQLWNVLMGDLSLVGPRPELPSLVSLYEKEVPYYNVRHMIKPGLSGWGQIHHEKPPHSIEETKEKLSYDLYYLKHRSFLLDLEIALKTIKTLLSRSGV